MSTTAFELTMDTAEAVLAAAGLDPTPVAECDDTACRWCGTAALPIAA